MLYEFCTSIRYMRPVAMEWIKFSSIWGTKLFCVLFFKKKIHNQRWLQIKVKPENGTCSNVCLHLLFEILSVFIYISIGKICTSYLKHYLTGPLKERVGYTLSIYTHLNHQHISFKCYYILCQDYWNCNFLICFVI